jgi:predicted ribosome quality control (RQC) complex YloA/Tae2 family protein
MPFDALTLHAVRDELEASLLHGRVQKTYFADEHSVVLEIYAQGQRRWLLASTQPDLARLHLLSAPPPRGTEAVTPFLLLLRKHVRDARLVAITQPPLERVLVLHFVQRDEGGLPYQVRLVAELMGRRSNLLLVDEDETILDCLKRVSAQTNPARPLVPRVRYTLPPAGDRLDPRQVTSYFALETRLSTAPKERTLAQFLAAQLAGLSPATAEEIVFRATGARGGASRAPLPALALHQAALELLAPLETHTWAPHLILRAGEPVDATPYRPLLYPEEALQPMPSMSAALERLYAVPTRQAPHEALRAPLRAALHDRHTQLERKLAALERALDAAQQAEALRTAGEAVLASLHSLAPGQTEFVFDGRRIALDPTRSPLENAQRYFQEYARARDAARVVPALLEQTRLELRYVEEMQAQVELADDPRTLEQLRRELVASGVLPPSRGEAKRGQPTAPAGGYRRLQIGGFEVLVGTSAAGNERVTFELSAPDDVWFHARGVPGSHVVVRSGGQALPAEVIEQAARLAAEHSAARHETTALVDWVPRKHVRKLRGAPPGLVTYTHEQTLRVRLHT